MQCRIDHYQTPAQIMASIYAKRCEKERSIVTFEPERVHLDLFLPDSKRFKRTLDLYGPINPEASTYKILGTKVRVHMTSSSPPLTTLTGFLPRWI